MSKADELPSIEWIRQADEGELRAFAYHIRGEFNALSRRVEEAEVLIADLSGDLTDEGANYSYGGLEMMRRRVANLLSEAKCPDWLLRYRHAALSEASQNE